ncbi:hypothetical protein A4G20_08865 [Pasteurellaceae bacterium RH1A]|nr:hypothetical protein A4G20_08865 [Pasteurellaceae bacterium RH1A]
MLKFSKKQTLLMLGVLLGGGLTSLSLPATEIDNDAVFAKLFDSKLDYTKDDPNRLCNPNAEEAYLNNYIYKLNDSVYVPFRALGSYSLLDLSDKDKIYDSPLWDSYLDRLELGALEKAEFKRNNTLPDEFVKLVEYSKSFMDKLQSMEDDISIKNIVSEISYDIEKEKLFLLFAPNRIHDVISARFESTLKDEKDYLKLVLDVPFDEMKKITVDPKNVIYRVDVLLKQLDKGSIALDGYSRGDYRGASYQIKSISPEVELFKGSVIKKSDGDYYYSACGRYENSYTKIPLSEGKLGTLKVKNPQLCDERMENCRPITISDSF